MPLEQLSNNLDFFSFFVASKQGVTGLTVTVDVWKHLTATNTSSQIVTSGSATEIGGGLYRYQLGSASVTGEGEYICIFKTSSATPDQREIPSIWCVQKSGSEYLDAAVTSRQATGSVTVGAYSSGQDPATLVWAAATRTLTGFGFSVTVGTNSDKTGYALAVTPPTAQQIWDSLTSALTTAGSVGKLVTDNINATIASRMATFTYTAPDNTSVGTILTRTDVATSTRASAADYTATRAGYLDATVSSRLATTGLTSLQADVTAIKTPVVANLDAAVSSRLATTGLTSLQADVTAIKTPVVANLDATVSSRLATASYTSTTGITSLQADITAIKTPVVANLDATVSSRLATTGLTSLQADVTAIKTPVVANLDAKVSSRITSGVGAIVHTTTILNPANLPIEGVAAWITSDVSGQNIVAGTQYSSTNGTVSFMLDSGSYYIWMQKSEWNFSNPTQFTVS